MRYERVQDVYLHVMSRDVDWQAPSITKLCHGFLPVHVLAPSQLPVSVSCVVG